MHLFEEENELIAIGRIHKFAKIAEAMGLDIRIGFSGGKDSQSVLSLKHEATGNIRL